ncbi:MAG: type VI secretion system tip protein VgrG, partial [Calditrichia bacterium]|nr:type VI secretion system tip protein VgrG [Calditrichia bacterium]
MENLKFNEPQFLLHCINLPDDALRIVSFEGSEQISGLYEYRFRLLSEDPSLDTKDILNCNASFILNRGDEEPQKINGIISNFKQLGRTPDYVSYQAVLVPRMWRLLLNKQSKVFQNMNIEDFISKVLIDAGFSNSDFDFKLEKTYPAKEFVVQYQETDLNFINRRLEHLGIFFFIDQRGENDVTVFCDSNDNVLPIEVNEDITFNPNKDPFSVQETISELVHDESVVTGQVRLKDYNYEFPSKQLLVESQLDKKAPGTQYTYGDHFKDENEGEFLARIRNEEIVCKSSIFTGKGDCRRFRAGYKFQLGKHYRDDWNKEYLLTKLISRGTQRGLFAILPPSEKVEPTYQNAFEAIPQSLAYRPPRTSSQPKIYGVMNAKVDAAGKGEHAEIDDQGRYKVILPFDLNGNKDGEASHYIRMIQPYAGPDYGFHFPLHKGTEVLLTFIDGNPDRPVISGAVPNP